MIDTACFRVVSFAGTGMREYHDLGFCIPCSDGTVRVIYTDREAKCAQYLLKKAIHVDVKIMLAKAHLLHTVERDLEALRSKVSDYGEVRR
jgi:hypothetical protein